MKKDDKLYCIENYFYKAGLPNQTPISDKKGQFCKSCGKIPTCPYIPRLYFTKGQVYSVLSILYNEIYIKNDEGHIFMLKTDKVDKYFTTLKNYRKLKLEELCDVNFNDFLKKLKNA
jgi:hypothetical protein